MNDPGGFVRLSLRPGETLFIKDFDIHDQYAIIMRELQLPPGQKFNGPHQLLVAQLIPIEGVLGWVWVTTDEITSEAIGRYMIRAGCDAGKWYSLSILWGRQCTQSSALMK